jgi:hypothetical protein
LLPPPRPKTLPLCVCVCVGCSTAEALHLSCLATFPELLPVVLFYVTLAQLELIKWFRVTFLLTGIWYDWEWYFEPHKLVIYGFISFLLPLVFFIYEQGINCGIQERTIML